MLTFYVIYRYEHSQVVGKGLRNMLIVKSFETKNRIFEKIIQFENHGR